MEMRFTKWGGHAHWHYPMELLGSDEHGTWFGTRKGVTLQRGAEPPVVQPHDFVTLVPAAGWYVASFNGESNHAPHLYVDVSTPPVIEGDVVSAVDLDLDVIRMRDGRLLLDDEDEFAEHQVTLGYPEEIIAGALASAEVLLAVVGAEEEPFGAVGRGWLARFANSAG